MVKKSIIIAALCIIVITCGCGTRNGEETREDGANTAPVVQNAEILPRTPVQGSRITLRIEAHDKENNPISYGVKWFRNDAEIGEGLEFYIDSAQRGDRIYAEVTPSDGTLEGESVRTSTVIVGNTPPLIRSARIEPEAILTSTGTLTVIGDGVDPDQDEIRWLCYWTLDYEERIDDSSLTINLQQLDLRKGSHITAELYAYDGDTVSTPYLLQIDVVNSHPELTSKYDSIPYSTSGISFKVPITDPDNDPLTFELLEAPDGITIDPSEGIISGQLTDNATVDVVVRATDSDGAYLDARFSLSPP